MRNGISPLLIRVNANTHCVSPSCILWLTFFLVFQARLGVGNGDVVGGEIPGCPMIWHDDWHVFTYRGTDGLSMGKWT
jgi:hypothetical protein